MRFDSDIKVFAGSSNRCLVDSITDYLDVPPGKGETKIFSEGNTYVKIGEKIRGMDVYIVQTIGLDPNNEFMELLFWLDAFRRSGANSITAIIPFFSYAKADKKDEPRVSIRARVCADCLESTGVDRVVTMDLHSPQIQGFFKKPVEHLYAAGIFIKYIKNMQLDNFVIVAPDAGFAKNARYYSAKLGVPLAIGNKQRTAHDEKAELLELIGNVHNHDAVIVDDFTISCGTLAESAKLLKTHGAKNIFAFTSHCLLNEKGIKVLMDSHINKLITTDTVYNVHAQNCDKVRILSVAELFGKAIKAIHEKESLSELFD